jgi:NADPH-dependent 2,4-dienoyl-CoA reductase/sulfur reductase-like enzyme
MRSIVIIGNGIAGITAARHIRKNSSHKILVISSESEYFFSRTALMYVFMGHMRFQDIQPYEPTFWKKNRIDLLKDYVEVVDHEQKQLLLSSGKSVSYDQLIIASGSKPNKFGWKGQDLKGVQGLYSKDDLDQIEENVKNAKNAVIIGGGLIGIEMAEMFISRGIKVTFLVREKRFWGNVLPKEEAKLIENHILKHHVDLRFEEELEEIVGDEKGRVKEIITKKGEVIPCEIVGLTAGVSPSINFLKDSAIEIDRGILVDEYMQTNLEDVFAIGDCAQFKSPIEGRRPIEQVWYTGRIMGESVAQTICGRPARYSPGPWFNSAKFFDIEYQTYGWVNAKLGVHENDFYWEHPSKEIALHVVWDKVSLEFLGINVFGMRMRHELFDMWLKEKMTIESVMQNLRTANFDPEFYQSYESEIIHAFNKETGLQIELQKKKWWLTLLKK